MVPKICSKADCERPHHARTFCDLHYRRHKNPTRRPLTRRTLEERFWPKVNKTESCWEWTANRYTYGHGQFSINGRPALAHRVSYEMANGPIPDGLVIDHMCHNPPCVNPIHLRAVTHKQNIENQIGAHVSSKSGVRGVWQAANGKWRAGLKHHGVRIGLGTFETLKDAEVAVIARRNELFTCNDADRRTKN